MLCQAIFLESWDNVAKICLFQQERDVLITETLWDQVRMQVAFDSTEAWEEVGAGANFSSFKQINAEDSLCLGCPVLFSHSLRPKSFKAPPYLYSSVQLPKPSILASSRVPFVVFGFTAVESLSAERPPWTRKLRSGPSRGLNVMPLCSDLR